MSDSFVQKKGGGLIRGAIIHDFVLCGDEYGDNPCWVWDILRHQGNVSILSLLPFQIILWVSS
jgi:hypothetical protein